MFKLRTITQLVAAILLYKGLVYSSADQQNHQYLVVRTDYDVHIGRVVQDATGQDSDIVPASLEEQVAVLKQYLFGLSQAPDKDLFMHPNTTKFMPPEDDN